VTQFVEIIAFYLAALKAGAKLDNFRRPSKLTRKIQYRKVQTILA